MKRWIHAKEEFNQAIVNLAGIDVVSVVFVSDASEYRPGEEYVTASSKKPEVKYSSMTREQLLQLPKKERERIHDIDALRKLKLDELTIQQRRDVTQANMQDKFKTSEKEVNKFLDVLRKENKIFMFPIQKNRDFVADVASKGGDVTERDVANIVHTLTYKDNYKHSKYSYLDWNWNALLLVFHFDGEYTFPPLKEGDDPVTVEALKIYIKIDVETNNGKGYVALSFHDPQFV